MKEEVRRNKIECLGVNVIVNGQFNVLNSITHVKL